jgi:pimeloyl-ACP methyl ester carboxylesterase
LAALVAGLLSADLVVADVVLPAVWKRYERRHPALDDVPGITHTADGMPGRDIAAALAFARRRIDFVRGGSYEAFDAAQREVGGERWFKDYVHRLGPREFDFARRNLAYDGRPALRAVTCPVLVIVGGRDTVVPAQASATVIEGALTRAGNRDVTVKTLADADHFLRAPRAGGPRETSAKGRARGLIPEYPATITDWLAPRIRPAR